MAWVNLLDIIYPVGSFYFSTVNKSPSETIGGTWAQIENATIRGSISDEIGYIGNDTHKLTTNEIPSHNHYGKSLYIDSASLSNSTSYGWSALRNINLSNHLGSAYSYVSNTGGGQEHSIVQRSFNCFIWYRTA